MRKITTAGIVLASALLFACQKEQTFDTSQPGGSGSGTTPGGSTTSGSLLGTWKFLGLEAQTQNTAVGSIPGLGTIKTVTYSKYTTEQNTGLLKFDDSKM